MASVSAMKGGCECDLCVPTYPQHWLCLQLQPNVLVDQLCMQVEPTDSSYMPSSVMVVGGNVYGNLQGIQKTVAIPHTSHNMYLLTNQVEVSGGVWWTPPQPPNTPTCAIHLPFLHLPYPY